MMILTLEQEIENILFKMTKETKALVSAIHNTDRIDGKANSSLGEFVHEAIEDDRNTVNKYNCQMIGCYPEIVDGKGEILNLFSRNPEAPAKFRDVKLSLQDREYIANVTRSLEGDWVLTHGGKKVRDFHFEQDSIAACQWLTGIILSQQVATRFKSVDQNMSLEVKARGKLLKTGDFVELNFYLFLLDSPTSGKALKYPLILNFTNGTYSGGKTETMDLDQSKERDSVDVEMDEDFEIDEYDDFEY